MCTVRNGNTARIPAISAWSGRVCSGSVTDGLFCCVQSWRASGIGRDIGYRDGVLHAGNWGSNAGDDVASNTSGAADRRCRQVAGGGRNPPLPTWRRCLRNSDTTSRAIPLPCSFTSLGLPPHDARTENPQPDRRHPNASSLPCPAPLIEKAAPRIKSDHPPWVTSPRVTARAAAPSLRPVQAEGGNTSHGTAPRDHPAHHHAVHRRG